MAHELGKTLSQVERMTDDELYLHMRFMGWRAQQEKDAIDKAKQDAKKDSGGWTTAVKISRQR